MKSNPFVKLVLFSLVFVHFLFPYFLNGYKKCTSSSVINTLIKFDTVKQDTTFFLYHRKRKIINNEDTLGFRKVNFLGKFSIRIFTTPPSSKVNIISSDSTFNTFERILKIKGEFCFLMNAGMFNNDYKPVGLLISDYKNRSQLDTLTSVKNGNFYLYPNGIFGVDNKNQPFILTTFDFMKNNISKDMIRIATQSGPMLVINDQIHKGFVPNSKNLNIRNGVGITKSGNLVFVISDSEISFYDFASIFKDFLKCKNALYLDGAISQFYFKNHKISSESRLSIKNKLGPVIHILE